MTFRRDRLLSVVVAILAIGFFVPTFEFPEKATYYPRGILILVLILCIPLWFKAKPEQTVHIEKNVKIVQVNANILYVILAIIFMIAFMQFIGFYIELPIFIAFIMYRLNYRKPVALIGISFGLTLIVYALFSIMLQVQIPMGLLRF